MDKKNVQNRPVEKVLTEKNLRDHVENLSSQIKREKFFCDCNFFYKNLKIFSQ